MTFIARISRKCLMKMEDT